MDVYWLEQAEADVSTINDWLSAREILCLDGFRFEKRRGDWRLGRWTAKNAVASYLHLGNDPRQLAAVEIRPAQSGAPEVFIDDKPASVAISVSHRAGKALSVVSQSGVKLGCDLEAVEPHTNGFIQDYFTPEEQHLVARIPESERFLMLALLWSAKESALKALQEGLRLDTRTVAVTPETGPNNSGIWRRVRVQHGRSQVFHGWWRHADDVVRTVVADQHLNTPIRISPPSTTNAFQDPRANSDLTSAPP